MRQDDLVKLVMKEIQKPLTESGEFVSSVYQPKESVLDDLESSGWGATLGICFPGMSKKAKFERILRANELYVVTNASLIIVVRKDELEKEARAAGLGDKVAGVPHYRRIHFDDLQNVAENASSVSVSGTLSKLENKEKLGADKLFLFGADSTQVAVINSSYEDYMEAAVAATLPRGMLENRMQQS
mmetsp:Transcript_609/g.887  ORF Transcript_609/g.887 Transcript_609/m.887 type:complete len:186 (-) Transcript_609:91-648(-)|eukprot:CAMPEP_0184543768 /NCGR_PEP_ID=MMETSP0199_2-20130426/3163_1 /TAXON_ID=1112570 /ORGANISM="Thraustochytrium sp., Strain LLF1b" /LENGTH=185 /DNA_ID=CAMNT_0026937839 /DNA_START=115 /DNA_END=672 /DNA_ORIENTATION=-